MPDTITGCVEEPDPCNPDPCGAGAQCTPRGRQAECRCPSGFKGDPYVFCKRGDCEYDNECPANLACFDFNCRDPCIGTCGQNANCEVRNHRPICSCPEGFKGDPLRACERRIVVGGRQTQAPRSEPRNTIVIGQQYSEAREPAAPSSRTVIGQRYSTAVEQPAARHTVGSRYSATGGSGICAGDCSSATGRAQSRQTVVIGAQGRKKRSLGLFTTIFDLTKFFARGSSSSDPLI